MYSQTLTRRRFLSALSSAAAVLLSKRSFAGETKPRNIVLIYADDVGYGDLSCYGATQIQTPNIDRIASQGIRFTHAHSPAATCTPSRYSLFTGEHAFRKKGTGILPGDARLIIEPGRATLPGLLQKAGYRTGIVGKWHLGLGAETLDWNGEIAPGPLDIGFDYNFIVPATGDRVPCVYVENRRVVNLDPADPIEVSYKNPVSDDPLGRTHPDLLKMHPSHGHDQTIVNGVSRIGYMKGGKKALWVDEDIADVITGKAIEFMEDNQDRPFFLFFATHDIHVPRVPHPRFAGKSGMGPRGDALLELDESVGKVLDTLQRLGQYDDTLIIFTSDNGPVIDDGYKDRAVELLGEHNPSGPWRGGKGSAFEAGTRVPFLVKWPGKNEPSTSNALIGQIDLFASLAALNGIELQEEDAPDSFNQLAALRGETEQGREFLIEQAGTLSLIQEDWKYIEPSKGGKMNVNTNTELGNERAPQLYNLKEDPGETTNLMEQYPERVKNMAAILSKLRQSGRSRPM